MSKAFVTAIVVGAGSSVRMGQDKIFFTLLDNPVLSYTLKSFEESNYIDEIIVVCKDEFKEKALDIIKKNNISKFSKFASGGKTRQQSVFSGVKEANSRTEYFAIHDAARALITKAEIDKCILDSFKFGSSALGVPTKDTIKVLNDKGFVIKTPSRSNLYCIQTPQVFRKPIYLKAMENALRQGKDYTDDCQLVESLGERVHIVEGKYTNLKITTPDDVFVFESILKSRGVRA